MCKALFSYEGSVGAENAGKEEAGTAEQLNLRSFWWRYV